MKNDICISCGMPLTSSKVRAGGDGDCCIHCGDAKGKLKSRKEIRAQMVAFFMKERKQSQFVAEKYVDCRMGKTEAWGKKGQN
ncbi:Uncharacterised protein [uncultured archaeon]|nr:Uncharacterised protein [uncultured archaeon]